MARDTPRVRENLWFPGIVRFVDPQGVDGARAHSHNPDRRACE